ncbi:MAG: DMT family transporter [Clostridiales bacterium]|nr:DMT family transporter [Clostridiales bacterium]
MRQRTSVRSSLLLVLTALIWGIAFVAQSEAMHDVGSFTFNGCRFVVGGMVLIPVILLLRRRGGGARGRDGRRRMHTAVVGGICCGLCLCLASSLQQFGIAQTTVGKAGFITALYIVIVPLLEIFLGKRIGRNVWISVLIAALGMYLLCIREGFSVGRGDLLVFFCAIVFSFHILVIDHFSPRADGLVISCVQFLTAGIISWILTGLFERPTVGAIAAATVPILYAGVVSCGVGYTLQVVAQKDVDPTIASLLMSLESVFSLLAGWVILGQRLSGRELGGCALVFAAIVLAQLAPERCC